MAIKDGPSSTSTENPVPSITLSITQDDVKRVLDASEKMAQALAFIQKRSNEATDVDRTTVKLGTATAAEEGQIKMSKPDQASTPLRTVSTSDTSACSEDGTSKLPNKTDKRPLHEMIFEAAQQCEHSMLRAFLETMKTSGSNNREIRAGIMVFHDMDLNSKLRLIFDVLGDESKSSSTNAASSGTDKENKEVTLTRNRALSLFRSIIVAISSCIHRESCVEIELDKENEPAEPPTKKRRVDPSSPQDICTSTGDDSVPALQSPSPSFDSSLAPLKEEDDFTTSTVRKEFEEIATYATDRLFKFAQKQAVTKSPKIAISFGTFEEWKKAEGGKVAPWLDLFDLSKWKLPPRSTAKAPQPSAKPDQDLAKETKQPEALTETKVQDPPKELPKIQDLPKEIKEQEPTKETASPENKSEEEPNVALKQETESPQKEMAAQTSSPTKETLAASPEMAAASPPMYEINSASRTVVSFDFTGSSPEGDEELGFHINITEENLFTLRNLVRITGLSSRSCSDITDILLEASKARGEMQVLPIERFHTCLHQLLGSGSSRRLSKMDKDVFSSSFVDFFSCFDTRAPPLEQGEAYARELAVGFCFLCAGNKSSKLAIGFDLMGSSQGLTTEQLARYLRSYLTMLVGISLLSSSTDGVMKPKLNTFTRKAMLAAVENGARWTLGHYLKNDGKNSASSSGGLHTFESFASWYTSGGYNVAPWLELLDLRKLLSLIGDNSDISPKSPAAKMESLPPFPGPKTSTPEYTSPRRSRRAIQDPFNAAPAPPPAEVLFTFPLANQRSLVVLKDDATYVKSVVEQLGLLSLSPDEIWAPLYSNTLKRPIVPPHHGAKPSKDGAKGKSMLVNKSTFIECMQETIQAKISIRKRSSSGMSKAISGAREVLVNFFDSFDLLQVDRVALNELMGGLTLLCGGKKSTKLAFAFGVFDHRPKPKSRSRKKQQLINSLGGEDLFLFLRSFLIVMFSCCRQSWDLSDDAVNRYIADTANMVTDDVMRYQWRTRKKDRVDFDEFGQWYNEGGFETAPWLELLDLKKWVLADSFEAIDTHQPPLASPGVASTSQLDLDCPPPPPEDSVDPSFFDDDHDDLMPMDSIDEMDILLMQPSSADKENDALLKLTRSFSYSPSRKSRSPARPATSPRKTTRSPARQSGPPPPPPPRNPNSLKFHLVTDDDHGGFVVSVSQNRIRHLRHVLMESGLYRLDGEIACKQILGKAYRDEATGRQSMTKDDFDSAMRGIIPSRNMNVETQRTLSDMLGEIFSAFDHDGTRTVNAVEVACGFTVLCKGKKSDKLEYAFEVLDRDRRGNLSRSDTARYLRSFLTVLLNIVSTNILDSDYHEDTMTTTSGMRCERSVATMARAVEAGSSWAAAQAFRNRRNGRDLICFDEFAEWYTHVGYSNIPWLELLDLQKWVITET